MPNEDDQPKSSQLEGTARSTSSAPKLLSAGPSAPKSFASLHRDKKMRREWFARIRIREDRLARLWVSNLAGHDVVVWSRKEKRWVALLAVPELRRALEKAQSELPMESRPASSRSTSMPPRTMSRPPDSLPPVPPLAQMNAAAAGVGELRLRSIAQSKDLGPNGTIREVNRVSFLPATPQRTRGVPFEPHRQQSQPLRRDQRQGVRSKPWQWRAMERVAWVAAGVLAMFVVSSAGSADEKPDRLEPAALLLTADQLDPTSHRTAGNRIAQSLGELLVGSPQQCLTQSTVLPQSSPPPVEEPLTAEPDREAAPNLRQRPPADNPQRPRPSIPSRHPQEASQTEPEVPPDLNFAAIRAALFNAAAIARTCPGENVSGKTIVTFEPSGTVRSVDIPLLIGDRPDRNCIVRSFKTVRVPAFTGRPVAVKKDF